MTIEKVVSLSKYRIIKELREQEIFKEELNNYRHLDTLDDMATQEDIMLVRYVK